MKKSLPILLALILASCTEKENNALIAQIKTDFDNAETLTGKVIKTDFYYQPGGAYKNYKNIPRRESHGILYIAPDKNPTNILEFHYFSFVKMLSEDFQSTTEGNWENADMFPEEIVSSNKPSNKITWKDGYRPFDTLIEVKQFEGSSRLMPRARYFSPDGKYQVPNTYSK